MNTAVSPEMRLRAYNSGAPSHCNRWIGGALRPSPARIRARSMTQTADPELIRRIAEALERLAPPVPPLPDFARHEAFVWNAGRPSLDPVAKVNRVEINLLKGIDLTRDILLENTERFAKDFRPTMPCSGELAAWASRRWSRPPTTRSTPGMAAGCGSSRSTARTSRASPPADEHHPGKPDYRFKSSSATTCPSTPKTLLQIAQGGRARRRDRGAALQHDLLCDVKPPPPPPAARHDRERAVDGHQPLRWLCRRRCPCPTALPLAWFPQLVAGRNSSI